MENVKINYAKVISDLQEQFNAILADIKSKPSTFENINELKSIKRIIVDDEQSFVKQLDVNKDNIFVAVKFGSATANFGSSVCSVGLRIVGTENHIKPTQLILAEFVAKYNLQILNKDKNVTQVWYTPTVSGNFNPVNTAFRSLFSMSGVLVIGNSVVKLGTIKYLKDDGEEEELPVVSYHEGFQSSMNTQPFFTSGGFSISEVSFSTDTFSISTYLLDTQFVRDCMSARGMAYSGTGTGSTKKTNDFFVFNISFDNGFSNNNTKGTNEMNKYKLVSYSIDSRIGEIPTFTASFTY